MTGLGRRVLASLLSAVMAIMLVVPLGRGRAGESGVAGEVRENPPARRIDRGDSVAATHDRAAPRATAAWERPPLVAVADASVSCVTPSDATPNPARTMVGIAGTRTRGPPAHGPIASLA